MESQIVIGKQDHTEECYKMLMETNIGKIYFTDKDSYRRIVVGIENKEIYVALNEEHKCIGFIWVVINAAFGLYPYLQLIIIDKCYQRKGIGKKLINYFENVVSEDYDKVFLMVSCFNKQAKKLYENLNYKFIGILANFYIDGIDEYLMMKLK